MKIFGDIWKYGVGFHETPLTKVSQVWSLAPPYQNYTEGSSQPQAHIENLYEIFKPLYALNHINLGHDGIPANLKGQISAVAKLAAAQDTNPIYTEYAVDDLQQVLYLEILAMIQAGTMIKKCRRCGKYFVVTNRNTIYCNRIDESGLRCSAAGPLQNFQKKMQTDEALKIYNRAYKTHHARVRKGTMSEEDFRLWYSEAKGKLEQVRVGALDIDSFQKWLKI